jgi:PhnB protein
MNMAEKTQSQGNTTVTPSMNFTDTAVAIEFYIKAFGAVERFRLEAPGGGIMHAEIVIGSSTIMMSDEVVEYGAPSAKTAGASPTLLNILVENDIDGAFQRAVDAGAEVLTPPTDYFWGHRTANIKDPFGYRWSLTQEVEQVSPEEINRRATEAFGNK